VHPARGNYTDSNEKEWLSRPEVLAPQVAVWLCWDDPSVYQPVIAALDVLTSPAVQLALMRDVFGNPFRPVTFDPAWRTAAAVSLARQMYESRDFGNMPILADALEDAGCDSADILTHCRDPKQVHVRGCWVVDLVLGKE
jgi:hypothetical protein